MTPEDFINKWRGSERKESSASQQHFLDLCKMLDVPEPGDGTLDPDDYDFEKSVLKPDGSSGSADVWKKGCFAWEYKGPKKSLIAAYSQVKEYADALGNPPLLIVSDTQEIQIHTNFTNEVKETHRIPLGGLVSVEARRLLRSAFTDPERLRPDKTSEAVTEEAAASIGVLATRLRGHDYEPRRVAHFLNKLVFCMFAEDIDLLPHQIFTEVLEQTSVQSDLFEPMVRQLFAAMRDKNGLFGTTAIPWFNGGLFDDDDVLLLGPLEIKDLLTAAHLDWSVIEPSIFGTLFERGLDPARRKEMASLFDAKSGEIEIEASRDLFAGEADKAVGVHYTDADKIMKIVEPVVLRPLIDEWQTAKEQVAKHRAAKEKAKTDGARTKAENAARDAYLKFRYRLGNFRVLDPACGSGNFLYLALRHLKDFDLSVLKEADELDLPVDDERISPETVLGIEINPYAAELAQVTIWIGEIQWQLEKGYRIIRRPILGKLANIQCRDALIDNDGSETKWPDADAIIGNPPFLGGKWMLGALGEEYVAKLRSLFIGRVPPSADLVTYWITKALRQLSSGSSNAAGLVATNMIRGSANRPVMDQVVEKAAIFDAWADEPWVVDGAAVRVSLISFALEIRRMGAPRIDGAEVQRISSDLRGNRADLTTAKRLTSNIKYAVRGFEKGGSFDVPGNLARNWLQSPLNPNGCPNSDVLRPLCTGKDLLRRSTDTWLIDFDDMSFDRAALYEPVFKFVTEVVKPERQSNRRKSLAMNWWLHRAPAKDLRDSLDDLQRYIATALVSRHRIFRWVHGSVAPDTRLVIIAREDDLFFGLLQSKFHELWTLGNCTYHGVGNDPIYTPSTTFETFSFPEGLTPNIPASDYADDPRAQPIAEAAKALNELRENWLNPSDLVRREPEVVEGYPDRILPVSDKAAKELKKRTPTNLYNQRPAWLDNAHRDLDEAVAAAYGWEADLSDDEILERLLALNLKRAAAEEAEK